MFDRTLNSSWDELSRRGWMTLTSFGLQILALGVLLVLPLLRPQGLPIFRQLSVPVSLGQPAAEPSPTRTHTSTNAAAPINPTAIVLRQPLRQPARIPTSLPLSGDDAQWRNAPSGPYIPGPLVEAGRDGIINSLGTGARPIMPVAPMPVHPIRLSHMSEGDLLHKAVPAYPPLARTARIQGEVVLLAVISKQGTIENLRLLSGHPMLAPAAIEAVRQWRYRPYILNDEPVEVETQITVNFSLAGN